MALEIGPEDPRSPDVVALLTRHLDFAGEHSPPEDVHALDVERLTGDGITFVAAREDDVLLGVGAVKRLDDEHAELKSMHTATGARGRGVARAILAHLIALAGEHGYRRVSLETGSMEAFAPARALYSSAGFTECPPFGDYDPSRHSTFMTLLLSEVP